MAKHKRAFAFEKALWGISAAFSAGLLLAWLVAGGDYLNQRYLALDWLSPATYRVAHGTSRITLEGPKGVCLFIEPPRPGEAPFRTTSRDSDCDRYTAFSYVQLGSVKRALTGLSPLTLPAWSIDRERAAQAAHPLGRPEPILLLIGLGAGLMAWLLLRCGTCATPVLLYRRGCYVFLGVTLCLLAILLTQKGDSGPSLKSRQGIVEAKERLLRGAPHTGYFVKTQAGLWVRLGPEYADLVGTTVQLELNESADVECIRYAGIRDCQPGAKQSWNSAIQWRTSSVALGLAAALFFFAGGSLKCSQRHRDRY